MAKPTYFPRLYLVSIASGRGHPEFGQFLTNVMKLNGKAPDFSGIVRVALVRHVVDASTLHVVLTENIRRKEDVAVEEVTAESLNERHRVYSDTVEHFRTYDEFPNISK